MHDYTDLTDAPRRVPSFRKRIILGITALVLFYAMTAYLLMPVEWRRYETRHPAVHLLPTITETHDDIPGDPLNLVFVGTEQELKQSLVASRWYPADPLTLRSCLEIAEATVLKHSYEQAPVSSLFLFGRKQDLSFEKPVGHSPRQRHHARFWKTAASHTDGRPTWVASATFDKNVGLSHTTGQITHHIEAEIDRERDQLLSDLREAAQVADVFLVEGFQTVRFGKNGSGDPWQTDGNLVEITLKQPPPEPRR